MIRIKKKKIIHFGLQIVDKMEKIDFFDIIYKIN
jgi:hypothetical protein